MSFAAPLLSRLRFMRHLLPALLAAAFSAAAPAQVAGLNVLASGAPGDEVATPQVRRAVADAGRCWSPTDLWGKSSSPVCLGNGPALVPGTPNRQCRQRFGGWGPRFPRRWTSHPAGGTSWDSGHSATFGSVLG